jgi:general secretion pathway protein D
MFPFLLHDTDRFRVRPFDDKPARISGAFARVRSPRGLALDKMSFFNRLLVIVLAALLALPPAPVLAKTRKGDKLRNEARAAELKGDYDQALKLAKQAMQEDPSDPAYVLEVRRVTFEDGVMHVSHGHSLRDAGHLDEALAEFQKAYEIDPSSDLAAQEIKRTKQMIERNKNGGTEPVATISPEEEKTLTPADLARKRVQERSDALLPVPELRPLNTDPIDLKMTNQRPRILFETVGKIAGINVVFDPEYDTQQTIRSAEIDLTRTTLDQALDQLSVITKSFWKPLSPNTIFVTIDNPAKRREYSEQVVKVYYLSNTTTPQEVQELLTVLRTVTDVQKVFNYTAQNALIVRAEADTMALVDKLVSDLDKPRSEVIVDVMVLQVSSTYIRNLTAAFAPTGINTSAVFAPRPGITTPGLQSSTATSTTGTTTSGTTTTSTTTPTGTAAGSTSATQIPLSSLGHLSSADYSLTTLPGATFEALLTDSSTRVLQSPQIRAVDNAKASLKIGDKVPTASGSFQSGVAGVGVSPLVNTQFTYLDVGVNVEITPKVHENNEVSMHMDLDVSQVAQYVNLGGINEPEISQNKLTTDIRLKQGEVNLIGGIIQQTDSRSISGIPGLASIPVLGHLFSGQNLEKDRTELVIALIPHVVRGQDIDATNLKGVAAGNATQIKVNYGPRPAAPTEQPQGVVTTPSSSIPAPPATAPPATAPPLVLAPPPPPAQGPAQAQGPVRMTFAPPNVDTQLNATVTVALTADNVTDMISAGTQLRYDPNILRITSIATGDLPQRNVSPLQPTQNIRNDMGLSDMSVSRGPQDGGVSGGGVLFTVVFQTVGRGLTNVTVAGVSLTSSTGQPINATGPPPLVVNVR